jgi:hypothetical protein
MSFSGGLDSTFALHAHKRGLLGRRGLDIEAAVLVRGFDLALDDDRAFDIARTHVKSILDAYGVRLNVVRTNWQKPFAVKWGMTHVLGIAAILHQFHRQFGFGVFADDVAYDNQVTPWSSNAISNQMLGSSRFPIRGTGAAWYRTEKAAAIAANPVVLEHIRVCYERPELGGNCGACEKCIRTKLNFYANGVRFVPALRLPLDVEQVRRTIPFNCNFLYRYVDLLQHGTWEAKDPIRVEVARLVRGCAETSEVELRRPLRPNNILQRAEKKLRRLRDAVLSLLPAVDRFKYRRPAPRPATLKNRGKPSERAGDEDR